MRMVMRLLGLELKLSVRNFVGRISRGKGGWRSVLLLGLVSLGFLPIFFMLIGASVGGYLVLKLGGQPAGILTLTLVFGQVVALVFGFFYLMSSFYFAQDLRILLPLPLRPATIVAAKFLRVVLIEYVTMGVIMLPGMIAYGIGDGSLLYWPVALIVFLLAPVLPLALAALVAVGLMSVTAAKRLQPSRDVLRMVGALVGVGIFLFIQFGVRSSVQPGSRPNLPGVHIGTNGTRGTVNLEGNPFADLFANVDVVQKLGHSVPPAIWATSALREPATAQGAAGLAGYVALNIGLLLLLTVIVNRVYLKGLLADEGGAARKAATAGEVSAGVSQARSPLRALFWREVVLLVRTPMFLLNAVLPMVIMPVALMAPLLKSGGLDKLQATLASGNGRLLALVPLLGTAILTFFASSTPLAGTAVSREGKRFWISRVLPVDPALHVQAKFLLSLCYTGLLALVGGMMALAVLRVPLLSALLLTLGGVTVATLAQTTALLIDLVRPLLSWTDPQQAMKGNINGLFGLLAALAELAVLAVLALALWFLVSPTATMPVLIAVAAAGTYGTLRWAMRLARVRYREIEE